jgi:DNA helicase TIP49 (TBP-interacting protein)
VLSELKSFGGGVEALRLAAGVLTYARRLSKAEAVDSNWRKSFAARLQRGLDVLKGAVSKQPGHQASLSGTRLAKHISGTSQILHWPEATLLTPDPPTTSASRHSYS